MARGCHVRVFVYMRCSEMLELMIWQQTRLAYDSIECSSAQGLRRELCASNQSFDRIMHACAANLCFIFIEDFMFCVCSVNLLHTICAHLCCREHFGAHLSRHNPNQIRHSHTHTHVLLYTPIMHIEPCCVLVRSLFCNIYGDNSRRCGLCACWTNNLINQSIHFCEI